MTASDTSAQTPSSSAPPAPTETPAAETPAATQTDQSTKASLEVVQVGNLATVTGSGFPAGERCQVSFTSPEGDVRGTVAIADEEGKLTTYGRLLEDGKYKISIADATGKVLATTAYTAQAS